jgi:hypothetical protein
MVAVEQNQRGAKWDRKLVAFTSLYGRAARQRHLIRVTSLGAGPQPSFWPILAGTLTAGNPPPPFARKCCRL